MSAVKEGGLLDFNQEAAPVELTVDELIAQEQADLLADASPAPEQPLDEGRPRRTFTIKKLREADPLELVITVDEGEDIQRLLWIARHLIRQEQDAEAAYQSAKIAREASKERLAQFVEFVGERFRDYCLANRKGKAKSVDVSLSKLGAAEIKMRIGTRAQPLQLNVDDARAAAFTLAAPYFKQYDVDVSKVEALPEDKRRELLELLAAVGVAYIAPTGATLTVDTAILKENFKALNEACASTDEDVKSDAQAGLKLLTDVSSLEFMERPDKVYVQDVTSGSRKTTKPGQPAE